MFSASLLAGLIASEEFEIVGAYTQPDRRAGRGKKLLASPVKQLAEQRGIPVFQPTSLRDAQSAADLAALQADVVVVVAYGLLLPAAILSTPRLGCINVHASLLPRWRGAAPVERAIAAGDRSTGITIMQMDEGLDTGAMLATATCTIDPTDTGDSLRDKLQQLAAPLLITALTELDGGTLVPRAQDDSLSCYAKKLDKQEGQVAWQQPATTIERTIRAFTSAIPVFSYYQGVRLRLLQATVATISGQKPGQIVAIDNDSVTVACGEQSLRIKTLQLPGAKAMTVAALRNGRPDLFAVGQAFSDALGEEE